jgi:mono/diheme cytochrome c family protein
VRRALPIPVLALLLGACAGAGSAAAPGGAGGDRPADPERLYRGHCGSCHRLRDPAEHTQARWAWALDEFGARAHLAPAERARVLAWLQARAADAPRP